MQHSPDRGGDGPDIGAIFSDPIFTELKARAAPFAVLRAETCEVVWANAAAAERWGAGDAAGLARILFGPGGRGGWLDGMTRGLVPGRAPHLARAGLARGFRMRAHTALLLAWTAADGAVLIGLAVPEAGAGPHPDPDAWRESAWTAEREAPAVPVDAASGGGAFETAVGGDAEGADPGDELARRGRLAVLRDRLSRALDGAVALRLLWRTDAAGALTSIDAPSFARLGSPVHLAAGGWPDIVAPFDPAAAERLRSVLATRSTWSNLCFDLPVADAAATVPMALSGSPVFGPGRAFAGFRGFGVLDLGQLALARHPAPIEAETPDHGAAADEAPAAEVAAVEGDDAPPVLGAGGPAPDAGVEASSGAAPAADGVDGPAAAPPPEPRPPANVVQLRAFQTPASGRFAAVPGLPLPVLDPPPEAADQPEGPLDDQSAFLALGEALRARIAAPSDVVDAPEAERGGASATAAGAFRPAPLDPPPVAVLIAVGDRPVFANAAASARLGYPDLAALLGAAAVPAGGGDRLALRDAAGRAVPARHAEVPWAGDRATLWLLSEPDAAEAGADRPVLPDAEPLSDGPRADGGAAELLDRVDDAVALLDASGRVRRLNRRGEGWFGRHGAGVEPERAFTDLLAPESRPAALALLGEVEGRRDALGAAPLRRDVVARTGDGTAVPMLLTLGRLGASGFYATLRDVTALKRAETDRARTERDRAGAAEQLPDLLAKVSHAIRTPLNAILGFAEVLMDERFGPLGNPRYKDYLKDVHASGTQLVALVDDLLDLSRIEAGQADLDVAAVDVNRVVAEAVAQMQPEAHRERVIMRTSFAGRVPAVLADERSARQIVRNLLSNAVKFNEPGGQVIVSTALGEAGAVLLRVRDTGVGMTDDEIAAALDPSGGFPARPPAQGNGLGLQLTRALVGANGASMTIRSRPREGTLVEVAFAPAGPREERRPA